MLDTQYIKLNMVPSGVVPVIYASQYDVGRPLGLVVYDGAAPVDLSIYTATIEASRSDGAAITASVTTETNIAAFETTATMTNKADKYPAQLVLVDAEQNRVASLPFVIAVVPAAMDENSEAIQEDASLYQQYTGTVQMLIAQIEQARIAADTTLQANINAEASTRYTQDNILQGQIDQLIAPTGTAPSAAEIENARIGADGKTYNTLGDAIRTQDTNINDALSALLYRPDFVWEIGKTIGSDGAIGTASAGAHTDAISVSGSAVILRKTPVNDIDDNLLIIHVCQYINGVFQSRSSIAYNTPFTLDALTDSIALNFTRQAATHITMTQADIDDYFNVNIYQQTVPLTVHEHDMARTVISKSLVASNYGGYLANLEKNICGWVIKADFSDCPSNMDNYFEIMCLSSESNADSRTPPTTNGVQLAFSPNSGSTAMRRIQSGAWTEWQEFINTARYPSTPRYAAFGDAITWGAVWDSDPETDVYQADYSDRISTRVANAIGSRYVVNYGVSSARFVPQGSSDTSVIIGNKIRETDLSSIDIVTIGGGRNDSATALGVGATATANDGTICGAVVDILTYLTTTYPKMQIVMYGVTPQPTSTSHDPEHIFTRVFAGGWSLATYYTEMSKVCARFGVPFIDWYDCPLILRWGVLSGGYSSGNQNWSHPLSSDIYKQMGNYIGGRVSAYYRG